MAEIRINATGGLKLYDADDSHYAQIVAGTITSNVDLLTLNSAGITVLDGAIDFDIASHDTSNGLKLGGTLVTATAAELNIMDGVTATAAEINLIDGGTARGTTAIADGDGVLINDAGTMRQTTVETLKTYIGAASAMNDLTDVNMDTGHNIDGLIIQTDTNGSAPGTGTLADAYGNIGIGKDVYAALTGADYTIAIGYETMKSHTTGSYAIGIGAFALDASTTGADNIAIGGAALGTMDTETNNIAIGKDVLKVANGAEQNTVVGTDAADAVTTGDSNSIIGYNAGGALTEGSENVFIGSTAGDSCTTGSNNILLGVGINPSSNSNDHCLGLGNNFGVAANDFTFGKASNTVTNDFDTDADWSRSSDLRLKRNIQDSTLGLDFINDLRPIKFQWKPSNEVPKEMKSEYNEVNQKNLDITSHGFIAQEVKEAIDKHGDNTFGGWHLDKVDNETQRVKKNMFVMPLIRAVQELTARVKELEDK